MKSNCTKVKQNLWRSSSWWSISVVTCLKKWILMLGWKKKRCRQWNHSLHQLKKRRHVGPKSRNPHQGKRRTRPIGFLLVFANQKVISSVWDETAKFVVPLKTDIKDSLTRQGMRNIWGHPKWATEKDGTQTKSLQWKRTRTSFCTAAQAHVTISISTAPDGGFHRKSMCTQTKPAHIPHSMLREVKIHTAM